MPGYGVIPSIRVRDTAAAIDFYTTKLGFEVLRGGSDNSSLKRGDARIMIEGPASFYSPGYNEAIQRRLGAASPNAWYIEAEDLEALYTVVSAAGVKVIDPLASRDWGQSEFTAEDPDGNWLTFWKATGQ
jgi:uncharacterized glyoxalase superfamily protein PhnB